MAMYFSLVLLAVGFFYAQGIDLHAPKQFISNLFGKDGNFAPAIRTEDSWKTGPPAPQDRWQDELPISVEKDWQRVPPIRTEDTWQRKPSLRNEDKWQHISPEAEGSLQHEPSIAFRRHTKTSANGYVSQQASQTQLKDEEDIPNSDVFNCNMDGLFSHPETCESYVHCFSGQPYVQPCPKGLHFCPWTKLCETPCDARCDKSIACECNWDTCESSENICLLPADKGSCNGYMKRFYFDSKKGQCKLFTYGGCEGNSNNFRSLKQCEDECQVNKEDTENVCRLPVEAGSCDGNFKRYFFESKEGRCKLFVYGGCQGNANNFKSIQECEDRCLMRKKNGGLPPVYNCIKDGLYPHPETCEKYVHCANGHPYEMPCPEGLHFNAEALRCDSPCNSRCDPSLAEDCDWEDADILSPNYRCLWDGEFAHPTSCKKFVICENGIPCEMVCPEGLHFNIQSNRCEAPCDARCDWKIAEECGWMETGTWSTEYNCTADGLYHHPENCEKYIQCLNGLANEIPCPKGLHFSIQSQRCEVPCDAYCEPNIGEECGWEEFAILPPDNRCVKDGLYKHRESCEKYVQCSKSIAYEMRCPENHHFNFYSKRCEAPCNARCNISFADECGWKELSALPSDICIKDFLFKHPESCEKYVQCSNGIPYEMSCPEGLHFNIMLRRCEIPCDALCDQSIAEECGWLKTGSPFDACSLKPSVGSCYNSVKRYYFDESEDRCKVFNYTGCGGNENNFKTKKECEKMCLTRETTLPSDFRCLIDGLYPHPDTCEFFVQCSNGNAYEMPCPKGLHFSLKTERCESPCDAHCDQRLVQECGWEDDTSTSPEPYTPLIHECTEDANYPHPEKCDFYIQCSNGMAQEMSCREGLHFNTYTKQCESPCEARCDQSIAEECRWNASLRLMSILPQMVSGSKSLNKERVAPYVPPLYKCIRNGKYPHPNKCELFMRCVNGMPHEMSCPEGLHFSSDSQRCVPPCEARCEQSLACDCGWTEDCSTKGKYDCTSPPDVGPCQAAMTRYYYDENTLRCKSFTYGGCGGNKNNYFSIGECRRKCSRNEMKAVVLSRQPSFQPSVALEEVDCSATPDMGPCFVFEQRIYYDKAERKCKVFLYGGCGGNSNNFPDEEQCRNKCMKQRKMASDCPSSNGKFPDMYDCKKYIVCTSGKARSEECPTGQAYDRYEKTCRREVLVSCPKI